jgi:hypothetical protein
MARIRSIHPAILTDEAFMTLTVERPLAIALLIGLWMEADDAGTFEWKPLTLKARILAAASDDIADLLAALVRNHFVRSFELNGRQYGVIRNFVKFQRPKAPIDSHPFKVRGQTPELDALHLKRLPNHFRTHPKLHPKLRL